MKGVQRRSLATIALLATLIAGCAITGDAPPDALSKSELCRLLGRDPKRDSMCKLSSEMGDLLNASFPPGMATQSQVDQIIGPYRVSAGSLPDGGAWEAFAVQETLLDPIEAEFRFDKNGVLVDIAITE